MDGIKMNILLGVTGGISAYKAADLIGAIKHLNYGEVKVIMTNRAKDFITPLTLATLSKNPVYDDEGEWAPHGRIDHIELAEWAETMIIAPTTANTISKLASGIADNLLTSCYLAFSCADRTEKQTVICPAMNNYMYNHSINLKNINTLKLRKNHIIVDPVEGVLACGTVGPGKLAPTKQIIEALAELL
jgi:phosphopantothenoylcysteine decarboxylase/phosphopantothenate--cysteine ligase